MKKTINHAVILVAAVAICFALVSEGQAAGADSKKTTLDPIWQITQEGTGDPVEWVEHTPNPRFCIYDAGTPLDETDDLVLDKETGLVWERSPAAGSRDWYSAITHCYGRKLADRKGSRLPTIEELSSLVDDSEGPPTLPDGHPFINVVSRYWSSTTNQYSAFHAWGIFFGDGGLASQPKEQSIGAWCVRGGHGYDAY